MIERVSPEQTAARIAASHPDIGAMFDYWRKKAGTRRMPRRSDIDPSEITRFLPRITLVDVKPSDPRFVYRLVGTEEVAARGVDPTGRPVAEAFFATSAAEALAYYEHVAETGAPYCFRDTFQAPDGVMEKEDVIFLPLSDDGENVNMVLIFYFDYKFQPRVGESSVLLRYRTWPEKEDE